MRYLSRLCGILVVLLLAAACSGDDEGETSGDLPDGAATLAHVAEVMSELDSVHFSLAVEGDIADLALSKADGDLTKAGDAQGTATVRQSGVLVEVEFVIVDDALYFKGPTGGFQKLPVNVASAIYDPSVILDPERGLPALVKAASEAKTEARETVNGVECYRIAATVGGEPVEALLPGVSGDLDALLWVEVDTHRLVQAKLTVPDAGTVTMTLSDFNAAVTIEPPI